MTVYPNAGKCVLRATIARVARWSLPVVLALGSTVVGRAQYTISTLAGNGPPIGSAATVFAMYPGGVAVDAGNNVYIASTGANRIYVVNGGFVTQVIGNGSRDYAGDGAPAVNASMSGPMGVALDSQGSNLYIADSYNSVVRKVTIANGTIGTITTVAGTGTPGYTGDMGSATSAQLNFPDAVAVDLLGNIFIADAGNNVIRVVSTAGTINTVANPAGVTFNAPAAVAVNGSDLYIADTGNNMIRKWNGTLWSVVAGTGMAGFNGDTNTTGVAPAAAELYHPSGVVVDGSGNVYIGDTYNQRIRKVNLDGTTITTVGTPPAPAGLALDQGNLYVDAGYNVDELDLSNGQISTLAGNGSYEFSGDGGLSPVSQLNQPSGVAVDSAGNVYIADTYNNRIREVLAGGSIVTVAGNGLQGYTPTAGTAANAQFNLPSGVAVDSAGNLYIADTFNHAIEKIVMTNGVPSTFSVVAGTNTPGYNGDNIPATAAELNYPWSVALDSADNLYIADSSNCRIREVLSLNKTIITLAGGTCGYNAGPAGATAEFSNPSGVAVTANGRVVFVADTFNGLIRTVTATSQGNYVVNTLAGGGYAGTGDGGPATGASLGNPYNVAVDQSGNVYIAETNGVQTIRMVADGIITTIAGDGTSGFSGDGGPATGAEINRPFAVAVNPFNPGNVYIADFSNSRVRELVPATTTISKLNPSTAVAGEAGFTLVVTGTNFVNGDQVIWNASPLPTPLSTTFVNGALNAAVPANLLASSGIVPVSVSVFGVGSPISGSVPFTIGTNLAVSAPPLLAPGMVNVRYLPTTIMAAGGTGSYTWSATGLPAGMSIAPTTGTISGTPGTNTGSPFTVVVTVTDSNSATATSSYQLFIYIAKACDPLGLGAVTVADVQLILNEALGLAPVLNDLDNNGVVNVADVQIVVNALLQLGCAAV